MAVGVEPSSGADGVMKGVAKGVADGKEYHKVTIAAVGLAQVLGVNARLVVRPVRTTVGRTATQMAVGVEPSSGADGVIQGVAKGVANSYLYHKIKKTAVYGVAKELCVNTRIKVWSIAAATDRSIAPMAVGIYASSSTNHPAESVAKSVGHR